MNNHDLTPAVHDLLARFHAEEVPDSEVACLAAVRSLAFDYTPAAVARVDEFLARFRALGAPDYGEFMASPSNRGLLRLLACLAGEATARYMALEARWLDAEGAAEILASTGMRAPPLDSFGMSLTCELPGLGMTLPLAAVEAALFADEPPSLAGSADAVIQRDLTSEVLRDPGALPAVSPRLAADPAFALGRALGQLACMLLDAARSGQNPVHPLLQGMWADGRVVVHSIMEERLDTILDIGLSRMQTPEEEGHIGQLMGYDGLARLPGFRSDALWLQGVWWDRGVGDAVTPPKGGLRVILALPYLPGAEGRSFAVHDPRLIDFGGDAAASRRLRAGLYTSLKRVDQPGGAFWPDQYRDEQEEGVWLARRPAVPWPLPSPGSPDPAAGSGSLTSAAEADFDLSAIDRGRLLDLPKFRNPLLGSDEPLQRAVDGIAPLLRDGQPVWGAIVQANSDLFDIGFWDLPAAVVYSPAGTVAAADLRRVAACLMALRRSGTAGLPADVQAVVAILEAETEHPFGHPIPPALALLAGVQPDAVAAIRMSALWVVRDHLATGRLSSMTVPLLVSDARPGPVAILPAAAWPASLCEAWQAVVVAQHVAAIRDNWVRLANTGTMSEPDPQRPVESERNQAGLLRYVREGETLDDMRLNQWLYDKAFPVGTRPPPMEWEWSIDGELRPRGGCRLEIAESTRARDEAFDFVSARQAFAARTTAHLIALHRQALVPSRGPLDKSHQVDPDEIQFAALGLLIGCPAQGELMVRLLLKHWATPGFFTDFVRAEVWVLIRLISGELRIPVAILPAADPRSEYIRLAGTRRPALFALLSRDAWREPEAIATPLFEAACLEHMTSSPIGPFLTLPLSLLLMLDFRRRAGLPDLSLNHFLLNLPLGPAPTPIAGEDLDAVLDALADEEVRQVRARMRKTGYSDRRIVAAVQGDFAPKTLPALARPRPARGRTLT